MKVILGQRVRDRVTGFEGVVIGRTEFLYATPRVWVDPGLMNDGKPIEASWFDEPRVEPTGDRGGE